MSTAIPRSIIVFILLIALGACSTPTCRPRCGYGPDAGLIFKSPVDNYLNLRR